jgi:hypothetical protein
MMATVLALALLLGPPLSARAAVTSSDNEAGTIERTPPRLSYIDGEVSFWRPGAQNWAPAQLNTPLAPGDELYTGNRGNLELQVGPRAFVRAWGDTQLGLANQEPDFLQLRVTSGHVTLDVRNLEAGRTVELDTPQAAFTIEHPGYYRVDVSQERTSFTSRRSGRATMTPAGGQAVAIAPSEEIVLEGVTAPTVRSYVAPDLDVWDRWNYARTDQLLDSVSARYVPSGVYGVDDLDHYGNWRVVPTYGPVWVPEGVRAGWVPYSTGKWIWDPYYGWTWVDTAPWGWAPYHYGRWVVVDSFWAWVPGPIVVTPVYAPALVAFFGEPGSRVGIGTGIPSVSWVALGWGEPLVPWWGRAGFIGRPWWAGWGGPRVVNNVVINRATVVNVNNITVYKNVNVQNAVVAVRQDSFGRRPVHEARIAPDVRRLEPVRGPLGVRPEASSFVAATGRTARPPEAALSRSVVATRPPAGRPTVPHAESQPAPAVSVPAPRIVSPPGTAATPLVSPRPPFGTSPVERARPPLPPRFESTPGREAVPAVPRDNSRRSAEPDQPVHRSEVPPPRERARARAPQAAAPAPQPTPPVEQGRAVEPAPQPPTRPPMPPPRLESTPGREAVPAVPRDNPRRRAEPDQLAPRSEVARERARAPQPPPPTAQPRPPVEQGRAIEPAPQPRRPERQAAPPTLRSESTRPAMRPLPGEPANRLSPGRGEGDGRRQEPGRVTGEQPGQPSTRGEYQGSGPNPPRERNLK